MPRRTISAMRRRTYRKTYVRHWREWKGWSLRQLADAMIDPETGERPITAQSIGRIENGLQPYSQPVLEAIANAIGCTPADLIMRNPLDTEAPWSIWETLSPAQRNAAIEHIKIIKRTGTD